MRCECGKMMSFLKLSTKSVYVCRKCDVTKDVEGSHRELPSLATQAGNFAGSFLRHAMMGFPKAPAEQYQERIDICNKCPFLTKKRKCSKCGCPITKKAHWLGETCPEGYWPENNQKGV
jgi:hypothetical protein